MREIKFRAWDKSKMVVVDHLTWGKGVEGLSEINEEMPSWFELMQFTGLTDKNSVDIYESDVLVSEHETTLTVYWSDKFSQFRLREDGFESNDFLFWDLSLFEVAGNIFENKELLAQGG